MDCRNVRGLSGALASPRSQVPGAVRPLARHALPSRTSLLPAALRSRSTAPHGSSPARGTQLAPSLTCSVRPIPRGSLFAVFCAPLLFCFTHRAPCSASFRLTAVAPRPARKRPMQPYVSSYSYTLSAPMGPGGDGRAMEGHPKANGFILKVAARPTCRENVLEIAVYREINVEHALTNNALQLHLGYLSVMEKAGASNKGPRSPRTVVCGQV